MYRMHRGTVDNIAITSLVHKSYVLNPKTLHVARMQIPLF